MSAVPARFVLPPERRRPTTGSVVWAILVGGLLTALVLWALLMVAGFVLAPLGLVPRPGRATAPTDWLLQAEPGAFRLVNVLATIAAVLVAAECVRASVRRHAGVEVGSPATALAAGAIVLPFVGPPVVSAVGLAVLAGAVVSIRRAPAAVGSPRSLAPAALAVWAVTLVAAVAAVHLSPVGTDLAYGGGAYAGSDDGTLVSPLSETSDEVLFAFRAGGTVAHTVWVRHRALVGGPVDLLGVDEGRAPRGPWALALRHRDGPRLDQPWRGPLVAADTPVRLTRRSTAELVLTLELRGSCTTGRRHTIESVPMRVRVRGAVRTVAVRPWAPIVIACP